MKHRHYLGDNKPWMYYQLTGLSPDPSCKLRIIPIAELACVTVVRAGRVCRKSLFCPILCSCQALKHFAGQRGVPRQMPVDSVDDNANTYYRKLNTL